MSIQSLGRKATMQFGHRSRAERFDPKMRFSAGNSTLQNGNVNFDPEINNLRTDSASNLRGLYSEASGNQNSFIQARVNPLQARVNKGRGALQRSLGRRNVFGTFANQDITNFETDTQRALGDARSLATNESIGVRTGLTDRMGNLATATQQGDLAGLGLGVNSQLGIADVNLRTASLQDAAGARAYRAFQDLFGGKIG